MQTKGQKAAKIIGIVLALLLVAGLVAVLYRFTNGFNEDFKTFYVEHDGERILSSESKMILETDTTYRFDVKYTFDTPQSDTKDYSVRIMPNAELDFDFTVDGERHLYSKQGDMTSAFGLKKYDTYFEFTLAPEFGLEYALQSCYPGQEVIVPEQALSANIYPYLLIVSSYNDSVVYRIALSIGADVTGVTLDPSEIIFTGTVR